MRYEIRNRHALRLVGATCIALVISRGPAATLPARADNSIQQQLMKIVGQAHAYETSMNITETGVLMHEDGIVVRHGKVTEMYAKITAHGQTVEMVIKGDKICMGTAGHWDCESSSPQFGSMLQAAPDQMVKALGVHVVFKSAGTKVVAGQTAVGYTFTSKTKISDETGAFWLDPSMQRIIEMDASITDTTAGKTSTTSVKALITHWNDPSLKIPAVPGV